MEGEDPADRGELRGQGAVVARALGGEEARGEVRGEGGGEAVQEDDGVGVGGGGLDHEGWGEGGRGHFAWSRG